MVQARAEDWQEEAHSAVDDPPPGIELQVDSGDSTLYRQTTAADNTRHACT
jgi:hypothetical protein